VSKKEGRGRDWEKRRKECRKTLIKAKGAELAATEVT